MRLAAIYNAWDGIELLRGSMDCLRYHVDSFIIVWQSVSNFGEFYDPIRDIDLTGFRNVVMIKYDPVGINGGLNERNKRNIGLQEAKNQKCTHFLHIDVDEYYQDFGAAKDLYLRSGHNGSVCQLYTYFKLPTLRFDTPDNYYVPFIHKLLPGSEVGFKRYPFYVDPTRKVNETDVVCLPDIYMQHFSWVRKDIGRKIRNSSARDNIMVSTLEADYNSYLSEGSFVNGYGKKLISVDNNFNIQI